MPSKHPSAPPANAPAGSAPAMDADPAAGALAPITSEPSPAPLEDVLGGAARRQVRVHEHGFLALLDVMPRLVPRGQGADVAIVQAARVSYGQGTRRVSEDRGLIRYLMRHGHTTPFEMVEFKFHVAMPIFVARQWIRHRTANVNEYSGRYSVMPDAFFRPGDAEVRRQSQSNRQGGSERSAGHEEVLAAEKFLKMLDEAAGRYPQYLAAVESGVSRELARIALPQSVYTQWYWKCDLHNTLRFLALRLDRHAQEEIRAYAIAMLRLIEPVVPVAVEAFRDYELEAVKLTRLEVEAIRDLATGRGEGAIPGDNAREQREWEEKRHRLGL
jgi:thymidylate synthase (FAD)